MRGAPSPPADSSTHARGLSAIADRAGLQADRAENSQRTASPGILDCPKIPAGRLVFPTFQAPRMATVGKLPKAPSDHETVIGLTCGRMHGHTFAVPAHFRAARVSRQAFQTG